MIDQPAFECEHPEHEVVLGMGASRHGEYTGPRRTSKKGGPDPFQTCRTEWK